MNRPPPWSTAPLPEPRCSAAFFTDRLRSWAGDFPLTCGGALLAACGMALALFSPRAGVCLLGYACMGAGLSPIVPILFSRAGEYPGVTPGEASAAVSVLAYGGLLFFPPTLGWLAHRVGLGNALLVVLGLCCCLALWDVSAPGRFQERNAGIRAAYGAKREAEHRRSMAAVLRFGCGPFLPLPGKYAYAA